MIEQEMRASFPDVPAIPAIADIRDRERLQAPEFGERTARPSEPVRSTST